MPATHTTAAALLLPAPRAPATPAFPVTVLKLSQGPLRMRDFGGPGQIVGTVHVKGVPNAPVRRRVRLFRDRDAICVGETWSDPATGAYLFVGVDPTEKYTALAYDYERNYRGVVADNLTPDPYP